LGIVEEAICNLTQAAEIYTSLQASPSLIAEVHYYFADCLSERGDLDGAIIHAQKCRKIRERLYGLSDIRVMDSCRQTAKMVLAPFQDYKGVLTPQIKQAYRDAIQCNEKIFRYLQSQSSKGKLGKRGTLRRKPSIKEENPNPNQCLVLGTGNEKELMCGPLVQTPYGWAPPLSSTLLHKITKQIVTMKLALIESPKHRECVRQLRARRAAVAAAIANGDETTESWSFNAEDARSAILRMAAVSPSVYLDDILQRIDHDDESAVDELGIVLTLTESETLGITAS
jgi:tetratricopeptide (TPR) repeat protein